MTQSVLIPLITGQCSNCAIVGKKNNRKGLNPLNNGAVFERREKALEEFDEGLNPLNNGAVFELRTLLHPCCCTQS